MKKKFTILGIFSFMILTQNLFAQITVNYDYYGVTIDQNNDLAVIDIYTGGTQNVGQIQVWRDNNGVIRMFNKTFSENTGRPVWGTVLNDNVTIEFSALELSDVLTTPSNNWQTSSTDLSTLPIITSPTHTALHGEDTYIGFGLQKWYRDANNAWQRDSIFAYMHIEVGATGESVVIKEIVYESTIKEELIVKINRKIEHAGVINENLTNEGRLDSVKIELYNDNYARTGTLSEGTDYYIENVPQGISSEFRVDATNSNIGFLYFSGNAENHDFNSWPFETVRLKLYNNSLESQDATPFDTLDLVLKYVQDIILSETASKVVNDADVWEIFYLPFYTSEFGLFINKNNSSTGSRTNHIEVYKNRMLVISEGSDTLQQLTKGSWVDESSTWKAYDYSPDIHYFDSKFNGKTSYVAVEISDLGQIHYGWLKITIPEDGSSIALDEWAVHSRPNTPIQIGQTEFNTFLVNDMTLSYPENDSVIDVNETLQMEVELLPENASNKTVVWTVENGTGEAEISSSGMLTGIAPGVVTVTATSEDNEIVFKSKEVTIEAIALGLVNFNINTLHLYPMPFSDYLNIDGADKVSIYDLAGKKVFYQKNVHQIETRNFNKGIYFIHYQKDNQTIIEKIIKQ